MTVTNFPGGISSHGVPIHGDSFVSTGNTYFVHSTGSNANDGLRPSQPKGTINGAVSAATADNGDVIYVMEGHSENLTAATDIVISKSGLKIIGLGEGWNRPNLVFTGTAGSLELDSANCLFSNMVLRASVSAIVVGVNVNANNVALDRLEFNFDATGDDFLKMVDIDAANRCSVRNCRMIAENTTGANQAIRLDDCDDVVISNNFISGDFAVAAILGEGIVGNALLIADNSVYNADTAAAANGIDLNVAYKGIIRNNCIGSLYAASPDAAIDAGSCLCIENYVANAVDESGTVVPTTIST